MHYQYQYPRPALTVDCVVFGFDEGDLKLLLIQRALEPFAGYWAFPGGFVQMDETLDSAARRELQEETGLRHLFLEQLYAFGDPNRDPRERVVSVAYFALVRLSRHKPKPASDANRARWFSVVRLPVLAFDHADILKMALRKLRRRIRCEPIGFELLPRAFTIAELRHVYEAILQTRLETRNFRKKILSTGLLIETGELENNMPPRAARLYRFDKLIYDKLKTKGLHFEL